MTTQGGERKVGLRAILALALALGAGACASDPAARPGAGDGTGSDAASTPVTCTDGDGDGFGVGCPRGNDCDDHDATVSNQCYVCATHQAGCPCAGDGTRVACGKVTFKLGNQVGCAYGERTCSAGAWGECLPEVGAAKAIDVRSVRPQSLGGGSVCSGNECDPYCLQFSDVPDPSLSNDAGIVATEAGLAIAPDGGTQWDANIDGPMPDAVSSALQDAGLYPDVAPDAIVYHELAGDASASDPMVVATETKTLDVYFLVDTTGSMSDEITALTNAISADGGIIDTIRAVVPDADFGVGHFEEFNQSPWNRTGNAVIPYEHVLSVTSDKAAAKSAAAWLGSNILGNTSFPESWVDSLYAMSRTDGLFKSSGNWWVVPRASWSSPENAETGACAADRFGYPCFRQLATPITVILTDAPSENGPGGTYAYTHDATWGVSGSTSWPTPTSVTGNGTAAAARAIDPTAFAIYTGSTSTTGTADHNWTGGTSTESSCYSNLASSKNVYFTFTLAAAQFVHFDTFESAFDTVLYVYRSDGTQLACNDDNYVSGTTSSVDTWLDAGTYYLVVDGYGSSNAGTYYLHVNAQTDAAPVAVPTYDQALVAYKAIGGRAIGIESSGFGCDGGYASSTQKDAKKQLQQLARDTGSVNGSTGEPYVWSVSQTGGPCHTGDPSLATAVASAVVDLTNYTRMDVTAVAADADDATDFDGPPGGGVQLTTPNVDDATFLVSATTIPSAETTARCAQTLSDRFVQCLPGTHVQFLLTFRNPGVPPSNISQIFGFWVRLLGDGVTLLGQSPVVIVVPPYSSASYGDGWFTRDYDTSTVCPTGTRPVWGFWSWTSTTPSDSQIEFSVAVAASAAELDAAPLDALQFTTPPGPAGLTGTPAVAHASGTDTQSGSALVDTTLALAGRQRNAPVMRMKAHLVSSTDHTASPLLSAWNLGISCQPSQ